MSLVNGHLGRRVSDLLDGQLSSAEADAAWAHVHTCHVCRDEVEREGWVKTRLSSLSRVDAEVVGAPDRLKGALLGMPPGDLFLEGAGPRFTAHDLTNRRSRRGIAGIAAIGGSAAGAAVVGVLAWGTAPLADIQVPDRRPQQQPTSQVGSGPAVPRTPIRLDR